MGAGRTTARRRVLAAAVGGAGLGADVVRAARRRGRAGTGRWRIRHRYPLRRPCRRRPRGGRTARRRRGSRPPSQVAAVSRRRPLRTPRRCTPPRRRAPRAAPARRPAPRRETPGQSAQASPDSFTAASVPEPGSTSSERIRPDDTPRPAVAAQSPVPVPRTGPVPCTNPMLAAAAEVDPAVHKVGSHPVLRLVLTNISGQPCVRDLDASRQEIVVWSSDGADPALVEQRLPQQPHHRPAHAGPRPPGRVLADVGRAHHDTGLRAAPHGRAGGLVPPDGPARRPDQPADPVPAHRVIQGSTQVVEHQRHVADLLHPQAAVLGCRCPAGRGPA